MTRRLAVPLLALALAGCTATQAHTIAVPAPAATARLASPQAAARPTPTPTDTMRRPITIALAGDVHFEGAVRRHLLADPRTAFGPIAATLRRADLAIANLETAVTDRGDKQVKQFVFRAPASAFDALRAAGIDVVTDANNHGMDYGQVGLADTLAAAKAARFPMVGSGVDEAAAYAPYRVTVGGWKVAVLGASQVIAPELVGNWTAGPSHPGIASAYRVDRLVQAVRQARATSDTVLVYLHWGVERATCPTDRQRSLANALVAAGADLVVGSHAHVVQGSGRLGQAWVDYGLGNFVFYAHPGPQASTSVVTLTVAGRKVLKVHRTPAVIRDGRPIPLTGAAATAETARQDALRGCTNLS